MALNGSVSVEATPNAQDLLVFSWSAVQDAAANTSTVSWMMQLVASTAGEINGVPVERDWSVTVDGQEFTGTANVNISNNETKTLASGEIVLEHNEDGTRSFDFAFSQDLSITWGASSGNPQFIGVVSGSGTGELDTIAEPEPEKFDIQGFMIGLAMGLCGRAVQWPKREPIGFVYGGKPYTSPTEFTEIGLRRGDEVTFYMGAVLPKLPKCDLPYMAIEYAEVDGLVNGGRLARLICSSEPIEYTTLIPALFRYEVLGDVQYWGYANDNAVWEFSFGMYEPYPPLNEWVKIGEEHFDERTDIKQQVGACSIVWANHDVVVADDSEIFTPGSVACSKSDPIPVYGIVGYIDDIPIYE